MPSLGFSVYYKTMSKLVGVAVVSLLTACCGPRHVHEYECEELAERLQHLYNLEEPAKFVYHENQCKIFLQGAWRTGHDVKVHISKKTETEPLK